MKIARLFCFVLPVVNFMEAIRSEILTYETFAEPDETLIALGARHTCTLVKGVIQCWGDDSNQKILSPPEHNARMVQISCASNHCCSLDHYGNIFCWGDYKKESNHHFGFDSDVKFLQISTGDSASCGIALNQTILCWTSSYNAKVVKAEPVYVQISCGMTLCCSLTIEGEASCWGGKEAEQLSIPSELRFKQISSSAYGSNILGVTLNGSLYCWGSNTYGQCDNKRMKDKKVIHTSAGEKFTCAVLAETYELECWGKVPAQRNKEEKHDSKILYKAVTCGERHYCTTSYLSNTDIESLNMNPHFECFGSGIVANTPKF